MDAAEIFLLLNRTPPIMAFPTANITEGSGKVINTLPNAGQNTMVNSLGVAIASDQTAFPTIAVVSGSITNPTSTLTRSASGVASATVAVVTTGSTYLNWPGAAPPVNGQGVLFQTAAPTGLSVGVTYWVRDAAGNAFNIAALLGGPVIIPGSAGTFAMALQYKPLDMIADSATAPGAHSFAILNSGGGVIIPRVRLRTDATSGWSAANLSINLWSAAPTYTGGDGQNYNPLTGSAAWLANFLVTLTQFGDGAVGSGVLTGANEMALQLQSGTAVFWDLQSLSVYTPPRAGQIFTLTAECMN